MLKQDIRKHIIKPSLEVVGLWSECAELLVYGTGLIETNYDCLLTTTDRKRIGFWQCSADKYDQIYKWLRNNSNKLIFDRLLSACYYTSFPMDPLILICNIRFAALICRLQYHGKMEYFSPVFDVKTLTNYYMKYYYQLTGKNIDSDIQNRALLTFKEILNSQ